ncbi:exportin-4 isoform X1 [Canna indica]|uniref:Exportin-4 n=1 Tax=Canna indica TaxID=4628 RepID=A0AAQ3K965_9LILI|nr:exportin-4 isoform X1 [Canna indica]
MQGFPGAMPDAGQLQSTLIAIERACSSIQMHMNPAEAEKIIISLRQSTMPYHTCRFILENSKMPNARFQAAGAIGDAAIREWGMLTDEDKKGLILFCLHYTMEHASAANAYVQLKVSAVAAQLVKRGWFDFVEAEKINILLEVKQAILGIHGSDVQFAGINFLESLVSEFSPGTSTAMGLPKDFHDQCHLSMELNYLKEFYCWAQSAAANAVDRIVGGYASASEEKVCSKALHFMFQILNWNFQKSSSALDYSNNKSNLASSGIRHDVVQLRKFERSLVEPGPLWHDALLSSGHTLWLLNFYATLRQKNSSDVLWFDFPLAVSARQLILQLCSLTGTIFPSDNGEMHIKHLIQILSAIIDWVEPPNIVPGTLRSGRSESEMVDGFHALLSMATLTSTMLFDNLLRSLRPFGTIHLLSALTCEVVQAHASKNDDEQTWTSEGLDILLEIWTVLLGRTGNEKKLSAESIASASNLFNTVVESHLKAAAESAFEDDSDADYFHVSVSKRDETLYAYALIARASIETTATFLTKLFTERFALLSQHNERWDPTQTLEELYWLLLITGHVLTDPGEGETVLVPEAIQDGFAGVSDELQHPVVVLSWSIINFARQSLDPEMRKMYFSPRLMEAIIWFLARWVDTYLMPIDATKGHLGTSGHDEEQQQDSQPSKRFLLSFAGQNQGQIILDIIVRISTSTLTSYPGENELQAFTCRKLLVALVRRRHVCLHLVALESWRDLARAFANERSLFSMNSRLQRSLAETLVSAASSYKDLEISNQYVRDLMGPMTAHLVDISNRNDLKAVAQHADAMYMVSCLLERLRGASRATQPRTQKSIFEMGYAVMSALLTLLELYKNQSTVVYLILKFAVDFVEGELAFLNAKETSILVNFCLRLLQIYSSNNIGKISLSLSTSLQSEAQAEKYKDLRALLQLLTNICSKDLVDFSSDSNEVGSTDIAEVIYVGLHIVTPLISLELLKYPKLSCDYFALVSHLLEVYPEKVAQLNKESFAHIIRTLDFGFQHQDADIVDKCLRAVNALASYQYKEKTAGKEGLGANAMSSEESNGEFQESILRYFLRLLLQLLLFHDFRMELAGSAADALLPLLLCEQDMYQRLVQEFLDKQSNPAIKTRLASAFSALTSTNQLSSSLDRPNRFKFRKNLQIFLTETSGITSII